MSEDNVSINCNDSVVGVLGMTRVAIGGVHLLIACVLLYRLCLSFKDETKDHAHAALTNTDIRIEGYLKYLSIIAIISSFLMLLCYVLHYAFDCWYKLSETYVSLMVAFAYLLNCVVNSSLFFVFLLRLLYCFQNTTYAASRFTKLYYLFWIIVCTIAILTSLSIFISSPNEKGWEIATNVLLLGLLIYFVHVIILLFTFVHKLSQMIEAFVHQFGKISPMTLASLNKTVSIQINMDEDELVYAKDGKNDSNNNNTNNNTNNKNNNEVEIKYNEDTNSDEKKDEILAAGMTTDARNVESMRNLSLMIRDMSKYTILIIAATITTVLILIFGIIVIFFPFRNATSVATIVIMLDPIINVICLYLQFYFSRNLYFCVCKKAHWYFESQYTKNINSTLKRIPTQDTILQLKKLDKQGSVAIERIKSQNHTKTTAFADMRQFSTHQ